MKCVNHMENEAVAVCAYCGRALCPACIEEPKAPRIVCSLNCAQGLARNEQALQTILNQGIRAARASAFYCYLCAALSAGAAVVAWFMLPSTFLILFTGGCAVVLLVSGAWYGRTARKQTL